jgi:hypothetical protein
MDSQLLLRGKYTFRVGGRKQVFVKKPVEHPRHVIMKALLWALYVPLYPDLRIEMPIGCKYKPDLVHMGTERPLFWGEAGHVGNQKLKRMLKRFTKTHFAFAVWESPLKPMGTRARYLTRGIHRQAPIDLIRFPADAGSRFIDPRGSIRVRHQELEWQHLV